jgi:hypothetical protein
MSVLFPRPGDCEGRTAATQNNAAPAGYEFTSCMGASDRFVRHRCQNPDTKQHMLQIGEGYVSLMALGIPTVFKVIGYEHEDEAIASVVDAVRLFRKADR